MIIAIIRKISNSINIFKIIVPQNKRTKKKRKTQKHLPGQIKRNNDKVRKF